MRIESNILAAMSIYIACRYGWGVFVVAYCMIQLIILCEWHHSR
jgi:hypothetical protein